MLLYTASIQEGEFFMDIERKNSSIIRDILIKVVLIVLFVFLLTFLFPMPNLTTFYDAVLITIFKL